MGKLLAELSGKLIQFMAEQKIFFVGTATEDSRVNVSPKGMDTLRVLGGRRVIWLNVTGSGNETSAHIQRNSRMTIMFCAFDGDPLILRLYGTARAIHRNDEEWKELFPLFAPLPGARQIFDFSIELVQTSCGAGVPCYSYSGGRALLNDWAEKKGIDGLEQYWEQKNQFSLDQIPSNIVAKNVREISD